MHRTTRKLILGLLCLASVTALAESPEPWQEIGLDGLVNDSGEVVDAWDNVLTDRSGRPLVPSCAFGPATGPYRFFYQEGSHDELVVFHTGGGACWEDNTCGTPFVTTDPTYSPLIMATRDALDSSKGIFDSDPTANPFAGASKVYIPYCSGDVGWGNKASFYHHPTTGTLYPLQHRGYANIRVVTEWLKRRFEARGATPSRVLVAGSSAGGYAAITVVFPEVAKLLDLGHTKISVLGDSANGIVTDAFLAKAKTSWGFDGTLPPHVLSAVQGGAEGVSTRIYRNSMQRYPGVRFSQYQNAYDAVQSQILNIMKHVGDPSRWSDPQDQNAALVEWTTKMRANTLATALNPAYRYYTAAGVEHGVLELIRDEAAEQLGFCSDDFATEQSGKTLAGPLLFRKWTDDLVNRDGTLWRTGSWNNATCFPNCIVPPVCGTGTP
jgi:pectinacetylesterase